MRPADLAAVLGLLPDTYWQNLTQHEDEARVFSGTVGIELLATRGTVLGDGQDVAREGGIRYIDGEFQGHNGSIWLPLSGGPAPTSANWVDGGNATIVPSDPDLAGIRVTKAADGYLGLAKGQTVQASPQPFDDYLRGNEGNLVIQGGGGYPFPTTSYGPGDQTLTVKNQQYTYLAGTWGGCVRLPTVPAPDDERLTVAGGVVFAVALKDNVGTIQYANGHFQGRLAAGWTNLDGSADWVDTGAALVPTKGADYPLQAGDLDINGDFSDHTRARIRLDGQILDPVGGTPLALVELRNQNKGAAQIIAIASEQWSVNGAGTDLAFTVVRDGALLPEMRFRLDGSGATLFPNTTRGMAIRAANDISTFPREMLDVAGAVVIAASTAGTPANGTLQYTGTMFQGRINGVWVDLLGAASISASPPLGPHVGQLWWRNDPDGCLFVYYDDGNSQQWVPAVPGSGVSAAATPWVDVGDALQPFIGPTYPVNTGRLTVTSQIDVDGPADNSSAGGMVLYSHSASAVVNPVIYFARTRPAEAAILAGDILGTLAWQGATATSSNLGATIRAAAGENFVTGKGGTSLALATAALNTATPVDRLTIDPGGKVIIPGPTAVGVDQSQLVLGTRLMKGRFFALPGTDLAGFTINAEPRGTSWAQDNGGQPSWSVLASTASDSFLVQHLVAGSTVPINLLVLDNAGNLVTPASVGAGARTAKSRIIPWTSIDQAALAVNLKPGADGPGSLDDGSKPAWMLQLSATNDNVSFGRFSTAMAYSGFWTLDNAGKQVNSGSITSGTGPFELGTGAPTVMRGRFARPSASLAVLSFNYGYAPEGRDDTSKPAWLTSIYGGATDLWLTSHVDAAGTARNDFAIDGPTGKVTCVLADGLVTNTMIQNGATLRAGPVWTPYPVNWFYGSQPGAYWTWKRLSTASTSVTVAAGVPVLIISTGQAQMACAGTNGVGIRIARDPGDIESRAWGDTINYSSFFAAAYPLTFSYLDVPGAGTWTYHIDVLVETNNGNLLLHDWSGGWIVCVLQ